MNLYNDNDKFICAWLRELIKAKLIPDGVVDCRSIELIKPDELKEFTQCHFFCGIAGWSYALHLAGWPESEPVWTGSCPCQPISCAGKRKGHADERHLWPTFYRLISECKPATVFGEQVSGTDGREWLSGVRADLEGTGYAVGCANLCAAGVGAPHIRQRLFWVADAKWNKPSQPLRWATGRMGREKQPVPWNTTWRNSLAILRAVDDGLPRNVAGCDAARNSIVPQVAAEFIAAYTDPIALNP